MFINNTNNIGSMGRLRLFFTTLFFRLLRYDMLRFMIRIIRPFLSFQKFIHTKFCIILLASQADLSNCSLQCKLYIVKPKNSSTLYLVDNPIAQTGLCDVTIQHALCPKKSRQIVRTFTYAFSKTKRRSDAIFDSGER